FSRDWSSDVCSSDLQRCHVKRLQGQNLHSLKAFYMATLGNARALQLDAHIGNFAPGKEADFVVMNLAPTLAQQRRQQAAKNINRSEERRVGKEWRAA